MHYGGNYRGGKEAYAIRKKEAIRLWEEGLDRGNIAKRMGLTNSEVQKLVPSSIYGYRSNRLDLIEKEVKEWQMGNPKGTRAQCSRAINRTWNTVNKNWNHG